MDVERFEHRHLDLVCDLDTAAAATRAGEWADLKRQAVGTQQLPGGVRIILPAPSAALARDLARREAQCCGFLDISVTADADQVTLDMTSPVTADVPLIDFLDR